jgi:hypothetical protein
MTNQANHDAARGSSENVTDDADRKIDAGNSIIDATWTDVADRIARHSIAQLDPSIGVADWGATGVRNLSAVDSRLHIESDHSDVPRTPRPGPGIDSHPDVFAGAVTINIVTGGNMKFIRHDGEAASDLATLMADALRDDPRSLLSDMLPAILASEAVTPPHFRSAGNLPPTTISTFSLGQSSAPPTWKYPYELPPTFKRGEDMMVTSGIGGALLTFLKNSLAHVTTTRPVNATGHAMAKAHPMSEQPMAFAAYNRPQLRGGYKIEKRRHFPVS